MYKAGPYIVLGGLNLMKGDVAQQRCPFISYIPAL
jgi:hypothetical protein